MAGNVSKVNNEILSEKLKLENYHLQISLKEPLWFEESAKSEARPKY